MASSDLVIILTTVPAGDAGLAIARTLVDERLAACVNVLPAMTSLYRWKDQVEREPEQQLVVKTLRGRVDAISRRIRELHPYELPELLVLEVSGGAADYVAWVQENARPA